MYFLRIAFIHHAETIRFSVTTQVIFFNIVNWSRITDNYFNTITKLNANKRLS